MENLETSKDEETKIGHKTADTSFFGYKTHIAMTEERIITAATITGSKAGHLAIHKYMDKRKDKKNKNPPVQKFNPVDFPSKL